MSTSGTTVAVIVAAFGASALTTAGTLGVDAVRSRRSSKRERNGALSTSCERLIGGALKLAFRCGTLRETMIHRSGFTEGLDIALHHRRPTDPMEIGDWLMTELGPILDAEAAIWLSGNEDLIRGASDVVLAASDVIGKSSALAKSQQVGQLDSVSDYLREFARRLKQLPRDAETDQQQQDAVHKLGVTCRAFGNLMRMHVKTADPEALLRAFPKAPERGQQDSGQ
jgi:hypothetical protein